MLVSNCAKERTLLSSSNHDIEKGIIVLLLIIL